MGHLTQEYLKSLLHYSAETGVFTWCVTRARSGAAPAGACAGHVHHSGYRVIKIDQHKYQAHRLAWLYTHGEFPPHDIDHINGLRGDNRIVNLRPATRMQNSMNRDKNKNNTVGYKCVIFRRGAYEASTSIGGRRKHVGSFKTIENAVTAQRLAEAIHWGEFARHGGDLSVA